MNFLTRLSFKSQLKIEFQLLFTGNSKVLENIPGYTLAGNKKKTCDDKRYQKIIDVSNSFSKTYWQGS